MPSYMHKMESFLFLVISRNLTTRGFQKKILRVNLTKNGYLLVNLSI
jgi:hypothetical protein